MFKRVLGLGKSGLLPPRTSFKSLGNKSPANGVVKGGTVPESAPETTFVTADEGAGVIHKTKAQQDEHEVNSARKEKRTLEAEQKCIAPPQPSLSTALKHSEEMKRGRRGVREETREAKRQKRGRSTAGKIELEDVSDLIGKVVQVPGKVFFVDVPGLYYVADVKKKERRRKGAVEVVFRDDNSRYWFPAADVRTWMEDQVHRGVSITKHEPSSGHQPVSKRAPRDEEEFIKSVDDAADEFAAEVLTEISTGGGSGGQFSTEQVVKEDFEKRGRAGQRTRKKGSRLQVVNSL